MVSVERVGRVGVVTMREAGKRNALSLALMRSLEDAFASLGAEREVRAIVLAGEGVAFSAGHDLRELREANEAELGVIFDACVSLMERIESVPQPVIAEVSGIATAAGCQLVAACDLAVAGEKARFATPGVRIGLFCSTPMVALSRAISRKRAMEMLLTGEAIDAQTALAWGLVNRVVPEADVRSTSLALGEKIAEASGEVVALGKSAFYRQVERPQHEAYAYTRGVMVRNAQMDDAREGMSAFIEKRPARWRS